MSKKIEILDNAIVITDTVSGLIVGEYPKRDIYFSTRELEQTPSILKLYDTNAVNEQSSGVWQDLLSVCVDSGLTPFTEASFRAFARVSLGFNIAPTPPAAQSLQSVSSIGSTASIATAFTILADQGTGDNSFLNLDGIGFGTGGTSIGFDDTGNGGGVQAIYMEGVLGVAGIKVTDASTAKGLFYAADYSASFGIRSLVDKGYVDAATAPQGLASVLAVSATVGSDPLDIALGSIIFNGNLQSTISQRVNGGVGISTDTNGQFLVAVGTNADLTLNIPLASTGEIQVGTTAGAHGFKISVAALTLSDITNSKGFVYAADYSALGVLDPRWIPDFAAVQAAIPTDSAVTANTAKITNATHTGDVAGATVLTIGSKKVTAAMMADGVAGELFTFDNNGVISKVPVGTATHVLTSNGIGLAPTFQAGGGGGASPLTTKGDLFGFSTIDARLAVGSAFQKLIPDNNEATGLKWVTEIGTAPVGITSGVTSGAATSGFLASTNNMVEYEMQGGGGTTTKILYYSIIVPMDYKSGGDISVNSWTTDFLNLTTWTVTGYINGTLDSVLSAIDITPTADSVYELTSNSFADAISAGDILQIKLNFDGSNGDDVRINKIDFHYNR